MACAFTPTADINTVVAEEGASENALVLLVPFEV
jgi:hypothetical protein